LVRVSRAENAILTAYLKPGSKIVVPGDVYGGTYRMLHKGVSAERLPRRDADFSDLVALDRAITPDTTLVWLESPTNPRLLVYDIAEVAALAHAKGAMVVVDNTFASPLLSSSRSTSAPISSCTA
jgi:cystathionine gamma-synthase